jgi:hypothetical protein
MNYERMKSVYIGSFRDMYLRLGGPDPKPWQGFILYWSEDNKYNITQLQHVKLDELVDRNGIGFLSASNILPSP